MILLGMNCISSIPSHFGESLCFVALLPFEIHSRCNFSQPSANIDLSYDSSWLVGTLMAAETAHYENNETEHVIVRKPTYT